VIFLWILVHKVHLAQTEKIYLRQYLPIYCTESIKKGTRKWFQRCSGGKTCLELPHLLQRHNRVFIDRLMSYFTSRLPRVTWAKTWTHDSCRQINLCNTVATLKCATQQKPNCMKLLPFSSLGRKFESVPCTHELHTSGTRNSSCFGVTDGRIGSVLLRPVVEGLAPVPLTSNLEMCCGWWMAQREAT